MDIMGVLSLKLGVAIAGCCQTGLPLGPGKMDLLILTGFIIARVAKYAMGPCALRFGAFVRTAKGRRKSSNCRAAKIALPFMLQTAFAQGLFRWFYLQQSAAKGTGLYAVAVLLFCKSLCGWFEPATGENAGLFLRVLFLLDFYFVAHYTGNRITKPWPPNNR